MSNPNPSDNSNDPRGNSGLPRPSFATILIWMMIIFVPVAFIWASGLNLMPKKADILTQSEFEKALGDGRVLKVKWVYMDGRYDNLIEGAYKKEGSQEPESRFQVFTGPYSDRLDQLIASKVRDRESEKRVNWLYPLLFNYLPLLLLFVILYVFFIRQVKRGGGAFEFGKSRARLWNSRQNKITFNDVCGIDEAKEELQEIVDYLKDPGKFQRLGGRIPRGVLMVGPPGTGKTLLARAIAGEAGVPFFSISGSDFVEMFVGVGASRVRDMFEEAIRNAPCLIFIDEIDAVGRSRFTGIGGGHDEREQTLNALLVQMDGFEQNTGVIVIAATNRPDVLDPALLRPGRFDRQVVVDLPDVAGRYAILKLHAAKTKLAPDTTNLHAIARGTAGFSGADLANLINEAALLAARHDKQFVEQHDLEEARDKVLWGKERRSRKIDDQERRLIAYHEAGHALAGLHSKHAEALHKITIIPRGNAYLGATMNIPEADRYTRSRNWFMDELVVLFGGRVAEKLIFDDISTGASQDIRQATAIAKKMVCEWGMTDRLGPINYGGRGEHIYLGRDITRSEDYSETTAREIDEEIRALVETAYNRTLEILSTHRDQLEKLAAALLERETLGAIEVYELLGMEERLAEARKQQEESVRKQAEEMAPPAEAAAPAAPAESAEEAERRRRLEAANLDDPPQG